MTLNAKNVLFCGEISDSSKAIINTLLTQNVKSVLISNTIGDSIERLELDDARLSHYVGNLTKIEDLEVIYTKALGRTKKKLHLVVNHKELGANDAWEDVITAHINSLICGTLLAIKHMGSMNAGCGGTVINSIAIRGRSADEYADIHRLLNDLDRSFSDPYYFNHTAVRILTMCTRMEIRQGSDGCAEPAGSACTSVKVVVDANDSAETHIAPAVENAHPTREDGIAANKKLAERFLDLCANKQSSLDQPATGKHIEEFEISVQN